jgi:hypothetical protein
MKYIQIVINLRLFPAIAAVLVCQTAEPSTAASRLREAGYATGFCGKWHLNRHYGHYLGWRPGCGPGDFGFEQCVDDFGGHPYGYPKSGAPPPVAEGEFPADRLTDGAIDFIRRDYGKPFLLWMSYYYVREPFPPPAWGTCGRPTSRDRALVWHFPFYQPETRYAKARRNTGVNDFMKDPAPLASRISNALVRALPLPGALGLMIGCATPTSAIAAPPMGPEVWALMWSDEFDGTALDASRWKWGSLPWGGTVHNSSYASAITAADSYLEGGVLKLRCRKVTTDGKPWTEGFVHTQGKLDYTYGYAEIRAKYPNSKGAWPAFWMLSWSAGWPPEIDVAEYFGSENRMHYGLLPDTDYMVSAKARSNGWAALNIGAKNYGGIDTRSGRTSSVWVAVATPFTTGLSNTTVRVYAWLPSAWATAYVDDFRVTRAAAPMNASFETGEETTFWETSGDVFVHQSLTGDGTVTMRLRTIDPSGTAAKSGIMLRESTASGTSRFAAFTSGDNLTWPSVPGMLFEVRSSTDLSDWSTLEAIVPAAPSPAKSTSWLVPPAGPIRFLRVQFVP